MTKVLDNKKIVLGISGGVDSSTAALLLKEKGYEVIGLYFDAHHINEKGRELAEETAKALNIQFVYRDVSKEFADIVISNFCSEYQNARTPNPCIICNPTVKFRTLIEVADQVGAYHIGTGHYAKVIFDENKNGHFIACARNIKKDQSYMLYRLEQNVISRLILPLEEFETKDDIRDIARSNNLISADLKDSQEICFIEDGKSYLDFLKEKGAKERKGNFVDLEGNVLGKHKGLTNYTIGQRKGLGVTFGKPVFVNKLDKASNTVVLGSNEDLFHDKIISSGNFFTETGTEKMPSLYESKEVYAKVRYTANKSQAIIRTMKDGRVETIFSEKQRAPSPGQSIVFYDGNVVIGGGFIY